MQNSEVHKSKCNYLGEHIQRSRDKKGGEENNNNNFGCGIHHLYEIIN